MEGKTGLSAGSSLCWLLFHPQKLDMSVDDRAPTTFSDFAEDAKTLAGVARGLSHDDLRALMSISPALAELNAERFAAFGTQRGSADACW